MNNLNLAMVEGFLVKDPTFSTVKNNISLCKFTIGNSRTYTRRDGEKVKESAFFDITTWTKLADVCGKFLKKGSRVIISGQIKVSTWKDDEGKNQRRVYVEGREVNFLPKAAPAKSEKSDSKAYFTEDESPF